MNFITKNKITKNKKCYLILLPVLAALIIALIPTLKQQWPLGWDIIYHVHYAQIYAQYGFTLTDPLLNSPYGQKIGYMPLFHFLIAAIGTVFGVDFMQVARFLQPVLAASIILSVSYVAYRFYGEIAGVGAGFLMLSSYLVSRIVLSLPENLALIFIPLAVYLYYSSIKNKNYRTAFLGGLLFIIVLFTHNAATLCLSLTIVSITVLELVVFRDFGVLKNFIFFFLSLILIAVAGIVALQIWAPQTLQNVIQQGITATTGISTSLPSNRPLGLLSFLGNIGVLVLIFSITGSVLAVIKHRRKDLILIVWILAMLLLSNAYWFGINVISYRVLIYLLIPLSIVGGYAISYAYQWMKTSDKFSSKKLRIGFLVVILGLSFVSGVMTVENPKVSNFYVKNEFETVQIAPPSTSEIELAEWFQENGNESRSFVISNQFTGMFIVTRAGMPMNYGFEFYSIKNYPNMTISKLKEDNIGYLVYDKRLVFPSEDNYTYIRSIQSEFFPLYYFSQNITTHFDEIKPDYATKVYENQDYIVCKIDY
ncbi:MAG: hypothetical protein KO316_06525 [Methanobacterium sp.]|jgi:hypothetical protein|nr:hypothetical protein [Methanobacterium sp.]